MQKNTVDVSQDASDGKINGRSKGKIAIIMVALCLAVFLAALDVTIVTTALPTISEHFHSATGYTWIGSAFLLANAASTPSWAKISDIFGRKPMLLAANVSIAYSRNRPQRFVADLYQISRSSSWSALS